MITKSQHALRVARPGEEAGRCQSITCDVIREVHVVIRDFVITDQCLGAKRQDAIYCIICGRKSSNGDQAQSGRYT